MEVIISTIARLHVSPQLKDYAYQYDDLLAELKQQLLKELKDNALKFEL